MVNPLNWAKLQILKNVLDNFSITEIVDVIDAYGKKEFGEEKNEYLDEIRKKMSNIVFEIGKRMGGKI